MSRVTSHFDPDRPRQGLVGLIVSDYLAHYGPRNESSRRLALLFLPRVATNPCLHATVLLRLATRGARPLLAFWRTLLIAKHSIDVHPDIEIGPGLELPHPVGIVFGAGVRIGRNVTIFHHVTLGFIYDHPPGTARPGCPTIGDDVVIYTQSILIGPITIGERAVIGAGSWISKDVAPGAVHHPGPRRSR
jgi:serine O-acetyltransferase